MTGRRGAAAAVAALIAACAATDAAAQSRVRRSIDGPVTRESIVRSLAVVPDADRRDAPAEVSVMLSIGFDFDSARLTAVSMRDLDRVAEALADRRMVGVPVTLEGHTDATGDSGYNLALSQRRADAVVDYLVRRGVARHRLRPVGYGEDRLLPAHAPDADRQRRVEIVRTL